MATPNYSKSEWASLSIQERIRAMNKVAGDDDSLQQSIPSVEDEQEEQPDLPKRSSVVDIWRNRDGGSSSASKPAKKEVRAPSPVSVPWPDEEDTKPPQSLSFQQKKVPPRTQPKAATSWRSQLKSASPPVVAPEEKEADLTILPSTSSDHDEEVAAASHSKSVMDVWTKRTLTIPDSPMTVEEEPEVEELVETPKRSSVVDIWTKRTSADTPKQRTAVETPKRSSMETTPKTSATPPNVPASTEKKKESPLAAWNRRRAPPKGASTVEVKDEKEADLVVIEDKEKESPKPSSVVNRYKQLAQLRNTPPRPIVVETGTSEETADPPERQPKQSSVVNRYSGVQLRKVPPRPVEAGASEDVSSDTPEGPKQSNVVTSPWGSPLRKVQRKSPSPVTTEPTVEDDEYTDESAAEEPKPSSIAKRWKPQASGESPQLQMPSPLVMPDPAEDVDENEEPVFEEPQRSSVVNRWNPQQVRASPQLPRVPKKVPPAIITEPSAVDADGDQGEAEEPQRSSVVNRWNPQGVGGSPHLRKVPTKAPPAIVTEPSAEDADENKEPEPEDPKRSSVVNRWNPQGAGASPQLRKVPKKISPAIVTEPPAENADGDKEPEAEEPQRSSVANRWNPQGIRASPQLRKVPKKAPPAIVTEPSAEDADGDKETEAEQPKRSNVANRWNPQGTLASPQLRKVIDKVATPAGAELSVADAKDDKEETVAAEPKQSVTVNRWNPQGTGASPQLRKVPIKVPPPIVTDLEAEGTGNINESVDEEPKCSSVANRWNPQGSELSVTPSRSSKDAAKPVQESKKPSVLDRYKPQGSGTTPRVQLHEAPVDESSPVVAQATPDQSEDKVEPSATEASQPPLPKSDVLDRYKLPGSRIAPVVPQKETVKSTEDDSEKTGVSASKPKQSSVTERYKPASSEKPSRKAKQAVLTGWSSQTKEIAPSEPTQLESSAEASTAIDEEAVAEEPAIEPAASLPFDESPTTKLFASIDVTTKSSGSTELEMKSEGDKLYDSTDADGFPSFSNEATKEEETPSGSEGAALSDDESAQNGSELNADFGVKQATAQVEKKPVEPKAVGDSAKRSKALELFATRRKYNHVVKVQTNSVETPVPKPAAASKSTGADSSSLRERKSNAADKKKFHSGTSAFTASPKESTAMKSATSGKPLKRSKRPKTMKEFLKQHTLKANPAMYSSETVNSRSSPSVGLVECSDKASSSKRTDLSVNTVDESVDTRESVSSSPQTDESVVPESVPMKERQTDGDEGYSQLDASFDTVLALAGETEEYAQQNEPGRIISNTTVKPPTKSAPRAKHHPANTPPIVSSPSPRTRTLQERRRGRHKQGIGGSPATPKALPNSASKKKASPFRDDKTSGDVQERAQAFNERAPAPSQSKKTHRAVPVQGNVNSNSVTASVASRWTQEYSGMQEKPVKPNVSTPATSDAGASDTLTFFSAASSGYSSAFSNLSVDGPFSPTSSLSNRASRALVRRRRNKLSKAEEKVAAEDLARRVISHTIKEQSPTGAEEDEEFSGGAEDEEFSGGAGHAVDESGSLEEPFFGQPTVSENDVPRGPGLSGRYNTSSRFMDSVQNIVKGVASNKSFDSGTTEGSSQIRSIGSTSDSEAWMSGKMRKSSSSLNRVPSDSTDGVSYQSSSVMTGRSRKGEEVVTDYFVSESSSNLEALKSAYEAVSLHQIAMDLTDEVSVATNVNLKKIASNLNEGMSAASSSLRSGLNNLNSGSSSTSKTSRKLKVPTASSSEAHAVDEEVAIEVEYMEDSDDEDTEIDSPTSARDRQNDARDMAKNEDGNTTSESGMLPAGEPSQENPADRRRAYV